MSTVVLPQEVSWALVELTGEPRADVALVLLVHEYAHYKLAEIDTELKKFEDKYGMFAWLP